jgi:hypothetical protein
LTENAYKILIRILLGCDRLRAKEKDAATFESRLLAAESQVTELQARLNDAVNQRRHFEDEYNVSWRLVYCSLDMSLCLNMSLFSVLASYYMAVVDRLKLYGVLVY